MKKVTYQLNKAIAAIVHRIASKGAGLPSDFGWYQPKVPEKLCK